jgi:septal ring factor EnvC (AmiA/AmiB activator)
VSLLGIPETEALKKLHAANSIELDELRSANSQLVDTNKNLHMKLDEQISLLNCTLMKLSNSRDKLDESESKELKETLEMLKAAMETRERGDAGVKALREQVAMQEAKIAEGNSVIASHEKVTYQLIGRFFSLAASLPLPAQKARKPLKSQKPLTSRPPLSTILNVFKPRRKH